MLRDRYGNEITTGSEAARDAYVEGVDHILAATYGGRDAFERAIAADPGFALAHVGAARVAMYASDMAGARSHLASAKDLAAGTTGREQAHIAIFERLLSGDAAGARDAVWDHVQDYPRDVLAAQLNTSVFGLIGFSGLPGREAEMLAFTSQLMPHYGEDWWLMSMHSLALCETGAPGPALALMDRALELNPDNANAAHFKAHEQYELGQGTAGLAYIREWLPTYDRRSLLHCHMSWHEALWALELGEVEAMWATVDDAVAPGSHGGGHGHMPINVVSDTAAIYWRASLAGLEVAPERWKAVSDYAAQFFPKSGQSFADMHAALAHAMAGDGERLAKLTETTSGFAHDLVGPVARTWRLIVDKEWQAALETLSPTMADHARFGGSRAQRDLLELTYVNILLKLGQTDEAKRYLQTHRPIFAEAAPVAGYAH